MAGLVCRFVACYCALAVAAQGANAAPAEIGPLTDRLVADASDGRLDDFDFLAAALVASGVEDECELAGWLDVYSDSRAKIVSNAAHASVNVLEALHAAMHEAILTGEYDKTASDLRLALTDGNFNCLSSLAIYIDLCQEAGLTVEIRLARGHVSLAASAEVRRIVMEPGATVWKPRRANALSQSKRISEVQLLAKFYYNRGVEALKQRQFETGIDLLQTCLAIDPADPDARANLVAGFNNWAVEHCRNNRYQAAATVISLGRAIDPLFGPLVANERLVRAKLGE